MANVVIHTSSATAFQKVKKDQISLKFLFEKKEFPSSRETSPATPTRGPIRRQEAAGPTFLSSSSTARSSASYDNALDLGEVGELNAKLGLR